VTGDWFLQDFAEQNLLLNFGRNVLGIKYQDEMKFNCLIFSHKYI